MNTHYRNCNLCEAMCGLEIQTEGNTVLSIKGDKEDPFSRGHICPKALGMKDIYEDPDRLKYPIKKTENGWEQISWEAAFEEVTNKLKDIQRKYGDNAIGVYQGNPSVHNVGTTLFSPNFVRSLKTTNRFSATSVDQLPHHLAAMTMFGHPALMPVPDIDRTDFWLILGGNPLVSNGSIMTAPDLGKRLRAIKKRGGKVVVVDPRRTETADKASQHIFIKPGTDVWLLLAMVNEVLQQPKLNLRHLSDLVDADQINLLKDQIEGYDAKVAAEKTDIPTETIQQLAQAFIQADAAVAYGRMGVSTVTFGSLCQWLVHCLNILTGNMDRAGGFMLPSPAFDPVRPSKGKKRRLGRWKSRVRGLPEFNGEIPSVTLAEEILTEGDGQIRAMVTSCGNPILSVPNGGKLDKAFASLEFMVSIDIYLNETTRHADIILPPATGLEVPHFDIGFNQLAIRNVVKYSDPVFAKAEGTKYDYEIFQELTKRMHHDELPTDAGLRQKIDAQYSYTPAMVLDGGLQKGEYNLSIEEVKKEVHGIDLGPLRPRFPQRLQTENKTINLVPEIYQEDLERLKNAPNTNGHLLLIGRRHLRSNNSWMHNSHRLVKGRERCTMLIHPKDAQDRNLAEGQKVAVSSRVGKVEIPIEISDEIMEGVVSIPHGWGHGRKKIRMQIAQAHAGVSANDLTDEFWIDELTGNAAVNGVPVEVNSVK
ncbi:MAG: molybdopterin oxidoreductase family protein [Bacteroidota bacterium]